MNAQRLLDLIKINEEAEGFNLSVIRHPCGTYGCLVGNYLIKYNEDRLHIADWEEWTCNHFDIPLRYVRFLFYAHDAMKINNTLTYCYPNPRGNDKELCINRVRKFVYYFLHKNEIIYDEKGGVREDVRNRGGDWMTMEKVKKKIKEKVKEKGKIYYEHTTST